MTTLIRSTSLMGYIDLVEELGGDPDAQLRKFLIDPEKVRKLDDVISHSAMIRVVEDTANQLECPDFGLQLAKRQDLMILGPLAVIALNAQTVGHALEQIIRYMHYYAPGVKMELTRDVKPGIARMTFDLETKVKQLRQTMDLTLGVADKAVRMLYGQDFRAKEVLLKGNSPLSILHYHNFFDAPVSKQQQYYALLVETKVLEKPIDRSDPQIHDMLEAFVQDALRDSPLTVLARVEHLIIQFLPTRYCNLKTIATQLGLKPHALQRQLAAESHTFDQVVDRVRRDRSLIYLAEKDMPMTQVACLLGYADQRTFNRACRRWFGVPPSVQRQQLLQKL
ncbi:AraC family transcriptional regulator [Microbulbifer magnicolonia]|uniref:AraC family transcriptional regulator n=1 Tax=Microbulbifer magnicolonia TaxID=3109744 RepID=UPI002B411D01|nr:AraC family transcriptional regulator ligand-binding domain-containing protein [Microbulbifer sp. GG15]